MIPAGAWLEIVAISAAAALVVTAVAVLLLRTAVRTISASITVVVLGGVLAVVAGVTGTGAAMFLSDHDLRVLLVVTAVSAVVATLSAVLLGRAVVSGVRELLRAARVIGDGAAYAGSQRAPGLLPPPRELTTLAGELAAASRRLSASLERERALEHSRRELTAWMSHDLRTPLAGLRAMAEALADRVVTDAATVARYHAQMRSETEALSAMVEDLFELSRIHGGALRLTMAHVSLSDLVSDALATAGPVAGAQRVHLTGRAGSDLPPVRGSTAELARVLRNLLSNAIRHTPPDGTVEIVGTADGTAAYLTVADACGGIPAEDLPRLFDVAFRGSAARTPGSDHGAGLGLAIARGLVEAHHGEITIANAGPGCQVSVRLPLGSAASLR